MAKANLSELLDKYQNRQQVPPENTPIVQDKSPTIDPKQIESLIDSRMSERELARKEAENYTFVKNKLIEQYGQNYSNYIANHMAELGITEDYLNSMARSNPKATLKMLGIDPDPVLKDPFRTTPRTNMTPFTPKTQEKKTWTYWQKMKEERPKEYYSPKTNVEMHRAALELGAEFEDGDFGRFQKDFRISY